MDIVYALLVIGMVVTVAAVLPYSWPFLICAPLAWRWLNGRAPR